MVQSQAKTVDSYISEAPADRAEPLRRLRQLAKGVLREHEEHMQWGMPAYVRADKIDFGFAQRKQYLSLYFINTAALTKNQEAVARLRRGKHCLQFRKSTAMDWDLIEKLLIDTRDSPSEQGAIQGP